MSAYNVKVFQYPNGTTQVRKYSKPLILKQASDSENKLSSQNEQTENQDVQTENKLASEDNLWHSACRAKSKIYEYARCVAWEYFVTFTFSPDKTDRYDYTECSRLARRWLNNQRVNAPELLYIMVPEQHKDGAWHFHALLANVGNIKFSDSGVKNKKGQTIYNMSKWSKGFTTATLVEDVCKVAYYIGKYITKELCNATVGKQRYFVSKNMPAPQVSTFWIDGYRELNESEEEQYCRLSKDEKDLFMKDLFKKQEALSFSDFLACFADSIGQEIVHISSPRHDGSFVDVDYYELMEKKDNTQ